MRLCWVNFQCRGVLPIWITVGQGSTALTVGAGEGCLDIFTLIYPFSPLSPSLRETARYICCWTKLASHGLINAKCEAVQLCPVSTNSTLRLQSLSYDHVCYFLKMEVGLFLIMNVGL